MKWSVRNTRVETELRGLILPRLLLVMNKLQKLLAGKGMALCVAVVTVVAGRASLS